MLDIGFATYEEVCKELGARLKDQRLAQMLTQEDLAVRAGLSVGTVKNIENKGQSSLESVVRLGLALGLADHFQELFNYINSYSSSSNPSGISRLLATLWTSS